MIKCEKIRFFIIKFKLRIWNNINIPIYSDSITREAQSNE
jgi:hypothetical protein